MIKKHLVMALSLIWLPVSAYSNSRVVKCDENKVAVVNIEPNFGTAINFPIKPDEVVLGSTKLFGVKYIRNDLVITSLTSNAKTNMFVYLFGRRCSFLLTTRSSSYDNVVRVQDPDESKIKVKINE
jgi:hypothetical protein